MFQLDSLRNKTAERKGDKALLHRYGFGKDSVFPVHSVFCLGRRQDLSGKWVWRRFL